MSVYSFPKVTSVSGAAEMASLAFVLAPGWAEPEAFAHALPESFPLLRRRVPVALSHATAETGATVVTVPSQSAEQDAAQQQ